MARKTRVFDVLVLCLAVKHVLNKEGGARLSNTKVWREVERYLTQACVSFTVLHGGAWDTLRKRFAKFVGHCNGRECGMFIDSCRVSHAQQAIIVGSFTTVTDHRVGDDLYALSTTHCYPIETMNAPLISYGPRKFQTMKQDILASCSTLTRVNMCDIFKQSFLLSRRQYDLALASYSFDTTTTFLWWSANDIVVSFIAYTYKSGKLFVQQMQIRQQFQHRGVGSMMFRSLEQAYTGVKEIKLVCQVENTNGMAFWRKMGFIASTASLTMNKRFT